MFVYKFALLTGLACASAVVFAGDDDAARAAMQKQLNAQVMAAPFDAGDVQKAEQYSEEAKKANVVPVAQPPAYWQPGWTCANMTGYYGYSYLAYRNCYYYHYYYGRYWR